jgi:hypothetical protein
MSSPSQSRAVSPIVGSAKDTARIFGRNARPWLERLARLGYAAKGVIYIIVGALALGAAIGHGGKPTDARGALHAAAGRSGALSPVLLGILALGMVGYALWGFFQAATDPEGEGTDAKGIAARLGRTLSGIFYLTLALEAYRLTTGSTHAGGVGNTASMTAMVMAAPLGRFWVALGGAGFAGVGVFQIVRGYQAAFLRFLDLTPLAASVRQGLTEMGRFGVIARGVVFIIVGWFLVRAALAAQPGQARGFDRALIALRAESFGQFLLGIVALGLIAYGAFMFVEARCHKIDAQRD